MTSSTSSSASRIGLALSLLVAGACAGAQRPAAPAAVTRIALFPAENVAAVPVPLRTIEAQLERALRGAGFELVTGERLEAFLEQHRVRYTGGVDGDVALAAHDEMGVDGIFVSAVEAYEAQPPRLAMTARLVAATREAPILWFGGFGRVADDSPGVLGLGIIRDYRELERTETEKLVDSLQARLSGRAPVSAACPRERRFRPRIAFHGARLEGGRTYSVAVLPLMNETSRRRAGDVVTLEVARQLATADDLRVIEPGVVRDRLLRHRIILEGGVSIDTARLLVEMLQADLVVAGYVREFADGAAPAVDFTVLVLERGGTVVWESTSHAEGSDGISPFGTRRISTVAALTCRMAQHVAARLTERR